MRSILSKTISFILCIHLDIFINPFGHKFNFFLTINSGLFLVSSPVEIVPQWLKITIGVYLDAKYVRNIQKYYKSTKNQLTKDLLNDCPWKVFNLMVKDRGPWIETIIWRKWTEVDVRSFWLGLTRSMDGLRYLTVHFNRFERSISTFIYMHRFDVVITAQ